MTTPNIRKRPRASPWRPGPAALTLAAASISVGVLPSSSAQTNARRRLQDCNPCRGQSSSFVQIPGTSCSEFAQCAGGAVSQTFACQGGLIFDKALGQCNWAHSAACGPDPECLPDPTPRPSPRPTPRPQAEPTWDPTMVPTSEEDTSLVGTPSTPNFAASSPSSSNSAGDGIVWVPSSPSSGGASPPSGITVAVNEETDETAYVEPVRPAPVAASPDAVYGIEPVRRPHHAAVWAHLNANKIPIANSLLKSARRLHNIQGSNVDVDALREYAYRDFYRAIRSMSEEGYAVPVTNERGEPGLARKVFYLGDPNSSDAAGVGLINAAVFLSQAMGDSVSGGSCDELNADVVDGLLPQSNACGQFGMSYQDMTCDGAYKGMECAVDGNMEAMAEDNGRPVMPFYCGSNERYPFTGEASVISGREGIREPVANAAGRAEVEGCCWWGRGTIATRGTCQYGKMNFYLGARAAAEGRPARFPAIDFCVAPQAICSSEDGEIEWTSGLFRWVEDVQSYDDGSGWNYVEKLHEFVAGGMTNGLFIHHVSSIVAQGCHKAPCPGAVGEMSDGAERWGYFLQVAGALGLPTSALRQE